MKSNYCSYNIIENSYNKSINWKKNQENTKYKSV